MYRTTRPEISEDTQLFQEGALGKTPEGLVTRLLRLMLVLQVNVGILA
jgi:hypothetical protein